MPSPAEKRESLPEASRAHPTHSAFQCAMHVLSSLLSVLPSQMCTTVASCFMTSCGRAMERREAARAFTDCKRACVRDASSIRAAATNASCGQIVAELNRTMANLNCLAPDAVDSRAAVDAAAAGASAVAATPRSAVSLSPLLASSASSDLLPSEYAIQPVGHSGWRQSMQSLAAADAASTDAFGKRAVSVAAVAVAVSRWWSFAVMLAVCQRFVSRCLTSPPRISFPFAEFSTA